MICLSGSILVFIDDLAVLPTPEVTHAVAPPGPEATLLPIGELLSRARAAHPELPAASFAQVTLPGTPGAAPTLQIAEPNFLDARVATLNPYTGVVIHNVPKYAPTLRWLESLHINLLLGAKGMTANSIGGLVSAALLLSGLWLWWPAKLRLLARRLTVKTNAGYARLNHDLHNALGIYTFPLLLVVSLSGAVFAFWTPVSAFVERATRTRSQPAASPKLPHAPSAAAALPIDRLAALAESAAPGQRLVSLDLPQKPGQPFAAHFGTSRDGLLPLTTVTLNPSTGRVAQVYSDARAPLAHRIMYVAYALHFGWWGGLGMMWIYAVGGALPMALYATGIIIWLRKRANRVKLKCAA